MSTTTPDTLASPHMIAYIAHCKQSIATGDKRTILTPDIINRGDTEPDLSLCYLFPVWSVDPFNHFAKGVTGNFLCKNCNQKPSPQGWESNYRRVIDSRTNVFLIQKRYAFSFVI